MGRRKYRGVERGLLSKNEEPPMSFRAILWAFKQDLLPVPKLVLVVLASHASTEDGSCFPRIRTIGEEASLSRRTVHRWLPFLEQKKLIRIERQFHGKARRSHKYWLSCPCAQRDRQESRERAADIRGYDTANRTRNHYKDHNISRSGHAGAPAFARSQLAPLQQIEQAAQRELALRLGPDGWEILTFFDKDVPKLYAKLRNGTLADSDLTDLRARYIEQGGARK
jgi:hypothetical protein